MRILYLPNSYSQQRQREKKANIYPVLLAMQAEFYRKQGHEVDWTMEGDKVEWNFIKGLIFDNCKQYDKIISEPENLPFLTLPRPDRVFTYAKSYTSGNYKYLPGTHIMSASGCWWGNCRFCAEQGHPYEVRPVEDVISEIEECKSLGFKEVFDDSATFPTGEWLEKFLDAGIKRNGFGIKLGCNCRVASYPFLEMHRVGYRMLLFGLESANQVTLDKINKGVKAEDIIPTLKKATEAGIEVHTAWMFGYDWETEKEAQNTLRLVHFLLRKGYSKTAQASFYRPTRDYVGNVNQRKYIRRIYHAAFYPDFWWVRRNEDIKYLWRGIKSYYAKD